MVRVVRAVAALALVAGLAAGCSSGSSDPAADPPRSPDSSTTSDANEEKFQPTDDDRAAIRTLLKERAQALQDGDRKAFMATVDPVNPRLVTQQQTLFANIQQLPVESVRYSVDDAAGYPTAEVEGDDPLFRPAVLEQVKLDVDTAAVTNTLEDTFVRRDGSWLLGAESLPGKYRDDHEPQSRPWAGGTPIAMARSDRLVMVVDGARADSAQGLADQMTGYIRVAADSLGIEPEYDVLVDATSVGAAHNLNTVDDSEAAATTAPVGHYEPGEEMRFAGVRIKVNPETAVRVVSDESVMRHELTHYLTQARLAGAPTWLVEGVAEWVSTAPAGLEDLTASAALVRRVRGLEHRIPSSGLWGLDPEADYLIGRAAVTFLVQSHGVADVLEMGATYRRIAGDDPDQKTARVLRRVVGISEAELVRGTWDEIGSLQTR